MGACSSWGRISDLPWRECMRRRNEQDIQFSIMEVGNKNQCVVLSGSSQYGTISSFDLALPPRTYQSSIKKENLMLCLPERRGCWITWIWSYRWLWAHLLWMLKAKLVFWKRSESSYLLGHPSWPDFEVTRRFEIRLLTTGEIVTSRPFYFQR